MSDATAVAPGALPAWLEHFAKPESCTQFTASTLAGGETAEPCAPEPDEQEIATESAPPEIDPDLIAQAFEDGRRSAQLELAQDQAALVALAQSLDALRPEPPAALAALLAETVYRLIREIVGSATVDGELLTQRAGRAAALVAEEAGPSVLFVHPEDLHFLESATLPVELAGDATLARGSVKLECGAGWIEDGPAVRLEQLRLALDRMEPQP